VPGCDLSGYLSLRAEHEVQGLCKAVIKSLDTFKHFKFGVTIHTLSHSKCIGLVSGRSRLLVLT